MITTTIARRIKTRRDGLYVSSKLHIQNPTPNDNLTPILSHYKFGITKRQGCDTDTTEQALNIDGMASFGKELTFAKAVGLTEQMQGVSLNFADHVRQKSVSQISGFRVCIPLLTISLFCHQPPSHLDLLLLDRAYQRDFQRFSP